MLSSRVFNFWGWLLVIVLVVYSILAITITIGGFFDVKEMFATMDEQHKQRKTKYK